MFNKNSFFKIYLSLEYFQLLDKEPINKSIIKGESSQIYHQQGAQLIDQIQKIEFIFGEKNNHHQVGNSYLKFNIPVRHPLAGFNINAEIRLVNIGDAFCFDQVTMSTTGGMQIELVKLLGQVSTIMRSLTNKDGHLLSYFDKIIDTDENASMNNKLISDRLFNSHEEPVKRGIMKIQLPLEHIFRFWKTLER